MRKFFRTCLRVIMKESVRAEQFLYVKHALQYMYVNGHAEYSFIFQYLFFVSIKFVSQLVRNEQPTVMLC